MNTFIYEHAHILTIDSRGVNRRKDAALLAYMDILGVGMENSYVYSEFENEDRTAPFVSARVDVRTDAVFHFEQNRYSWTVDNREISAYIRHLAPTMPEDQIEEIAAALPIRSYKRGSILVRQGEIATDCYFVLNGCLRLYFTDHSDNEKTVDFFTEEQSLTIFESYQHGKASPYGVDCTEDTILLEGDLRNEELLYERYPELKELTRRAMEEELNSEQHNKAWFKSLAPHERYQYVLKNRPQLAGRVPQHQLASYLGVTPESLSRIKKRLHESARSPR